jgi:hypothetical protein
MLRWLTKIAGLLESSHDEPMIPDPNRTGPGTNTASQFQISALASRVVSGVGVEGHHWHCWTPPCLTRGVRIRNPIEMYPMLPRFPHSRIPAGKFVGMGGSVE